MEQLLAGGKSILRIGSITTVPPGERVSNHVARSFRSESAIPFMHVAGAASARWDLGGTPPRQSRVRSLIQPLLEGVDLRPDLVALALERADRGRLLSNGFLALAQPLGEPASVLVRLPSPQRSAVATERASQQAPEFSSRSFEVH
jgi:hypothetical protein